MKVNQQIKLEKSGQFQKSQILAAQANDWMHFNLATLGILRQSGF